MRMSKTYIYMTSAWAVLLLAGLMVTAGEPSAPAQTKMGRQVAAAEGGYVRCLKLRYASGHRSGNSLALVAGACGEKSDIARAAFLRAGFRLPEAQGRIERLATNTQRKMRILMPPCPEEMTPSPLS